MAAGDAGAKENVEIHMFRPNLDSLPDVQTPPGFSLRQGPDPAAWVAIQQAAEPFLNISLDGTQEGAWQHEFIPGEGNLPLCGEDGKPISLEDALRHQFFIVEESTGRAVGTATAWLTKHHAAYTDMLTTSRYWAASLTSPEGEAGPRQVDLNADGLVHWVAVHPEYQGRGLSKPLLAAVLQGLGSAGRCCKTATLGTGSGRPQAIPLYLSFGFEPMVFGAEDLRAWRELHRAAAARAALGEAADVDERTRRGDRVLVDKLRLVSETDVGRLLGVTEGSEALKP
ncbi:ARIA [Symbiodinium natans]|uniref:ARIA protein n=1 Tax=Symbiodinium natans TaxID=878477 RepID=A0A812JXK9_9DINO|nr:ARIA [Symbiodinium natans]